MTGQGADCDCEAKPVGSNDWEPSKLSDDCPCVKIEVTDANPAGSTKFLIHTDSMCKKAELAFDPFEGFDGEAGKCDTTGRRLETTAQVR